MAICSNCGAKVGDDVKFCPSCGGAINRAPAPAEAQAAAGPKEAFCPSCGSKVGDGVKFCPSCGAAMGGAAAGAVAAPAEGQTAADRKDAEEGKLMAILAYFLFFIPLLTGDHKKSPFVRFHTNQGTVLFIVWIAWWVGFTILDIILFKIFRIFGMGWFIGTVMSLVGWLFSIAILALDVMGIISAVNGKKTPLPLIGKYTIIK